jgi:hypothetical protein
MRVCALRCGCSPPILATVEPIASLLGFCPAPTTMSQRPTAVCRGPGDPGSLKPIRVVGPPEFTSIRVRKPGDQIAAHLIRGS